MKEFSISKSLFSSEVTAFKKRAIWTRMESSDSYNLEYACKGGERIELNLKSRRVEACLQGKRQLSFQTQKFLRIPYYNIHHFQFLSDIDKKDLQLYFSGVNYVPKLR